MNKRRTLKSFLIGLLVVCTGGLGFPSPLQAAEPGSTSLSTGDGLTRDSLSDFGTPEPGPAVQPVSVVSPVARARMHSHRLVRHRAVHPQPVHSAIRVVKHAPARRNLAVSFVYWWNGWVIRTFHTTDGTVMLKRIGAKA